MLKTTLDDVNREIASQALLGEVIRGLEGQDYYVTPSPDLDDPAEGYIVGQEGENRGFFLCTHIDLFQVAELAKRGESFPYVDPDLQLARQLKTLVAASVEEILTCEATTMQPVLCEPLTPGSDPIFREVLLLLEHPERAELLVEWFRSMRLWQRTERGDEIFVQGCRTLGVTNAAGVRVARMAAHIDLPPFLDFKRYALGVIPDLAAQYFRQRIGDSA